MKVLVVDDDAICLEAISHCLSQFGHQAHVTASGTEALDCIEEEKPDVVISDRYMPGMNGMELLEKMCERFPDVPVILMTGSINEDLITRNSRAYGFIQKPIKLKRLFGLLAELEESGMIGIRGRDKEQTWFEIGSEGEGKIAAGQLKVRRKT